MFFRKRDKVVLTLTPQEARYARSILLRWRNKLIRYNKLRKLKRAKKET